LQDLVSAGAANLDVVEMFHFLILALFGALPRWSHSRDWGYMPTGGLGFVLVIVVILVLLGRI
jgi:hypothetical protein